LKTLYCNSFEVSHSKEAFCLILKFESPDGHVEVVYATMSPSGAKSLLNIISKQMSHYEKEHGKVKSWITNPTSTEKPNKAKVYVS
jgi:hypothetical protein